MKKEEIQALFSQFEQVSCILNDVECWSAKDWGEKGGLDA